MIKRKNNKHTHLHNKKLWVGDLKLNKTSIIIFILFVISITFMTVGFARYGKTINFGGTAIIKPDGKVYISGVTKGTHTNATSDPGVTSNGDVNFNLSFRTVSSSSATYVAVFNITITNDSSYDYVFRGYDYRPTVTKGNEDYSGYLDFKISGIKIGYD